MASSSSKKSMEIIGNEPESLQDKLFDILKVKFLLEKLQLQSSTSTGATSSSQPAAEFEKEWKKLVSEYITPYSMLPFYKECCVLFSQVEDKDLVKTLANQNEDELNAINERIKDAETNLGESEIRSEYLARANFYARIGHLEKTKTAFKETLKRTVGSGESLDIVFKLIRVGIFHWDVEMIHDNIELAKTLCEKGGDWDRRNRLKVYEGVYLLSARRDFKGAAKLLLSVLSTFTCYELFDYETFVRYTILVSIVSLDRPDFKRGVLDSPDVRSVIKQPYEKFIHSLYHSEYATFFKSLAEVSDQLKFDHFFARHNAYFVRELRIKAYSQLLQSYRSVRIDSMAEAFGVTTTFIDKEISRFIASDRLHCKIDKVAQIIHTHKVLTQNALYSTTIKHAEHLENRLEKLQAIVSAT